MFTKAQINSLGCFEYQNYSEEYDAVFIGSDEVFNFIQSSPWGFSPQLFGSIKNNNVNTYAASFGYSDYEDIINNNLTDEICTALQNLKHISVRDNNSYQILKKLNFADDTITIHLDPVLVGDLPKYNVNAEPFILIYAYDFRMKDKELIQKIKAFATHEQLKIYCVGFYQTWCDKNVLPEPTDIFKYFCQARYIITDTFHGSIFAMRMHKQFVTLIRDTNRNKLKDMLIRTNMEQRMIDDINNLASKLKEEINYDAFETLRLKEREKTISYLKNCLQ